MHLQERGTQFDEEVEVDEKNEVEVFKVPPHNNINGAVVMNDFKLVSYLSTYILCLYRLLFCTSFKFIKENWGSPAPFSCQSLCDYTTERKINSKCDDS